MKNDDVNEDVYFNGYKVDKENSEVVYSDEEHVYLGKKNGSKYVSCTTLISMYHEKFNKDFWSKYKALEAMLGTTNFKPFKSKLLATKVWNDSYLTGIEKEDFEVEVKKVLDAWDLKNKTACEYGTRIHAEQENLFYDKPQESIKKYGLGGNLEVRKNKNDIMGYGDGIYPELLISYTSEDEILKLAGQADLIVREGNRIKVLDFKTNEKLEFKSYYDPKTKKTQNMLLPLNHLMDCNMVHYQIQLSIYAYLLQQLNPDFIIDELRIIHFPHEGGQVDYTLEYLKDDVEKLLNHYKISLKKNAEKDKIKPIIY